METFSDQYDRLDVLVYLSDNGDSHKMPVLMGTIMIYHGVWRFPPRISDLKQHTKTLVISYETRGSTEKIECTTGL